MKVSIRRSMERREGGLSFESPEDHVHGNGRDVIAGFTMHGSKAQHPRPPSTGDAEGSQPSRFLALLFEE